MSATSVYEIPIEERVMKTCRMLPGGADGFIEKGWRYAEHGLEECGTCHAGTVWRDPSGTPRHPWCEKRGGLVA